MKTRRDVAYGPLPEQKLDLYIPTVPLVGAVLMIHGGVTVDNSDKSHLDAICSNYASNYGVAAFTINYRGVWPDAIQDCQLAVRWYRKNYGDMRVVSHGFSRGGQLSAWMNVLSQNMTSSDILSGDMADRLSQKSPSVSACVTDSAPLDLTQPDFLVDQNKIFSNYDETGDPGLAACSPILTTTDGGFWYAVPRGDWYISHGINDDIVPIAQAEELINFMQYNNLKYTYKTYAGGHCYSGLSLAEKRALNNEAMQFAVGVLKS